MKRFIVLVAAVLSCGAVATTAAADDVKGPKCADIVGGSVFYSFDGTTASGTATLADPFCKGIVYTYVVLDNAGDMVPIVTDRGSANAVGNATFQTAAFTAPTDGEICVYFVTSSSGGHVFDRAPDTGCEPLKPGGSAGGGGFN